MKTLNPIRHPKTGEILEISHSSQTDIRATFDRILPQWNLPGASIPAQSSKTKLRQIGRSVKG